MPLFLEYKLVYHFGRIYMDNIIDLIKNSNKIAVLPHISADGDAIGSCRAMAEILKSMGKTAYIYTEEPVERRLKFLDEDINVYDGAADEFDLSIALDCGDIERLGERKAILDNSKAVINIDHHRTNTRFGDYNFVVETSSATGEILAGLFKEMGIKLTDNAAKFLYTAICSDSGCFAYSNTSPQTMRTAAELMEYDFDHSEITHLLFNSISINTALMKAELTSTMHSYCDGRVRIVTADEDFGAKYGLEPDDIQGLVDIPRNIEGTEIAVSIKNTKGKIKASMRSNGNADVSAIALEFGGGGHTKAAGCAIDAPDLETAEKMVVQACERALK